MSNISIKGGETGTGVFTISAPNGNTNRTLTLPDEAGTVLTSAGVPSSAMPAGSVLQLQHTQLSTPVSQALTASALTEITGFFVNITPKSVNSKILLQVSWMGEITVDAQWSSMFSLQRDTTYLGHPVTGSRNVGIMPPSITYPVNGDNNSTPNGCMFQYIDTPATLSQVSYKVCITTGAPSVTIWTNGVFGYAANPTAGFELGMSTITAMEIAG
jgi:hypothetical protein